MAITVTIETPTVVATEDSFQVSLTAHYLNGGVAVFDKDFSKILNQNTAAERNSCINDLAKMVNDYKAVASRQVTANGLMAALKTAVEAKL